MPDVRYSLPGVPPGPAMGISAFTPPLARQAASGAQSYKYAVAGYPGTRAIPVDTHVNGTPPSPDPGDMSQMGSSRSSDAPDAFWPNQYYQTFIAEPPGGGYPVQVYDPTRPGLTSLLPVPAVQVALHGRGHQAMLARRAVLQRVRQLPWFPRLYKTPRA